VSFVFRVFVFLFGGKNVRRFVFVCSVLIALPGVGAAEDAASTFQARVLPVLTAHCTKCHGPEKQKAKINLAGARDLRQLTADRDLWFRVLAQIEAGAMPPEGEKPPSAVDRRTVAAWIRGDFAELMAAKQRQEGRSKLRRFSRREYAYTIYDLFGIRPDVDLNLPEDGRVDGYDRVSAALPLSAEGALGYFKLTDDLLKKWVLHPSPKDHRSDRASRTSRAEAMESGESPGHSLRLEDNTIVSFNTDTSSGRLNYRGSRVPGLHRIRVSVYGYQTDKPLPFGIYVGHTSAYPQILELAKVLEAPPGKAAVLETELYLKAGVGMRLIPFGLGVPVPKNTFAKNCKGPGLAVQWMEDEEPELPLLADRWLLADFPRPLVDELRLTHFWPSERQIVLMKTKPKNQAKSTTREEFVPVLRATFQRIGARLYRRDLTGAELDAIMADVQRRLDDGSALETVFLDKVMELMTAPDFLCVIESPGRLSDFALASRLSYFLWSSTPDEALLDLARKGKLHEPKVLREQTERLLNDPKSDRFVADFVRQWLGLRAIDDTSPDRNLYPEYNDFLKTSSVMETEGFFRRLLDDNLSVRQLVDSRWVLVNEELARHYGLPGVIGAKLRKVDLPESSPYGGIWTQSAVLKVTANGTNTSPVKRGVWVAERLLGTPIPPPPPNIKPVEPDVRGAVTLREQLALHRGTGACASCHAKFDPYGFALESFDVTGRFRAKYREVDPEVVKLPTHQRKGRATWRDGLPVDPSGQTLDGQAFADIAELRKQLASNPEQLARGVTRHLVTYATGAPATAIDQPAIDRIARSTAADGYGLRSLVHAVVQSDLFGCK
jgi:hypothetical protein